MLAIGEGQFAENCADFLLAALADPKQIDAVRVVAMSRLVDLARAKRPVRSRRGPAGDRADGQDRPRTDSEKRLSAGCLRRWHTLDADKQPTCSPN